MFRQFVSLFVGFVLFAPLPARAQLNDEPFRPQFHFTPERNWMNDPNGMVFYDGEYHLFYQYNPFGDQWGHMSWGHAVSPDMVHWERMPVAIPEADGVMIFSGSAVVDWENTSGLGRDGEPPMVAIYTGHHPERSIQDQRIAYSLDNGRTWTNWEGNPVLDLNLKDFRDPKVFWSDQSEQWVMVLALSADRKIAFYGSEDLKTWSLLSEFGPAGATEGVWECPDMWPLAVDGNPNNVKWVLEVDLGAGSVAGGSGGQYFIGDWDGERFTLDSENFPDPVPAQEPAGAAVFADFEGVDYGGWTSEGDAFGDGPAKGALEGQQAVDGFQGSGLVNSFRGGDGSVGRLTSPSFAIDKPFISFLIGGGAHRNETCIELLVGQEVVASTTGADSERLEWRAWDVREWSGKQGLIRIVDERQGGWGHINVDQIVFADAPGRPGREAALWVDYGKDFYAAVSWSDIPESDGRRLWLGWLSNWQYAQDVPTSPWRSVQSIAREDGLSTFPEGVRLTQQPVQELNKIRSRRRTVLLDDSVDAINQTLRRQKVQGRELEIEVELDLRDASDAGIYVCAGNGERTAIGYDTTLEAVYVDRRDSGATEFHGAFAGIHRAPLRLRDGVLSLRIFVDRCSVEVFAGRGQVVLTDLIFPSEGSSGIEFYSNGGDAHVDEVRIHPLESIWR